MLEQFDYIVIGSGSSGGVLAARLSEDPQCSVLLLEAGQDKRNMWTRIPLGTGKILAAGELLWQYETDPDPGMHDRQIYWPRGRVLGGSSSVNGMIWVHGDPQEYDAWEQAGCRGWGASGLRPYFRRVERFPQGDPGYRGHSGPIHITEYNPRHPLADAFLDGCERLGIRRVPDYNERHLGAGYVQFNTRRGKRCAIREGYLDPARGRRNLTVLTGAAARRVLFEGRRAVGVEYDLDGSVLRAHARSEVILCAGAFNTPQLLELSGVGDQARLRAMGITPIQHSPSVGENLSEHLYTAVSYECTQPLTLNEVIRSSRRQMLMGARYLLTRNGLMTSVGIIAQSFAKSDAKLDRADLKIQIQLISSASLRGKDRGRPDPFPGFSIASFKIRPESRGSVHIQSPDASAPPRFISNYLSTDSDCESAVTGLRMSREIARQGPLHRYIKREVRPGAELRSDDDLLDHVRRTGSTAYHPVGTCRMGDDAGAVVDSNLRVRGVDGLRVADASIMPTISSTNTNAICMVIGEKAADLIRGKESAG